MSGREGESDSDAPEEFTLEQGLQQDENISKVQRENKYRVVREGKKRRREWAQKLTPKPPREQSEDESIQETIETDSRKEPHGNKGMLPSDIVQLLAAREKKVFLSDTEEEKEEKRSHKEKKTASKKKKHKSSALDPIILSKVPPPPCAQDALDFLKKKKMQVPRSSAVLNNSNQALRFLSSSGLLK